MGLSVERLLFPKGGGVQLASSVPGVLWLADVISNPLRLFCLH